jgi:hypothetical protein
MGVGSKLFLAVLRLLLLYLDDDVGDCRTIGVEHDNIRPLRAVPTESNRIFNRKAAQRIAIMPRQSHDPKLPDGFFGFGDNVSLANWAPEKGLLALFVEKRLKRLQFNVTERFQRWREIIASKKIQKSHPPPHNHHRFVRL